MNSFLELLQIYRWSLPASIFMAGALTLIGAQWTARKKSSQIFVLGQGSALGIIAGLALNIVWETHFHGLSLLVGISLGGLTLLASDALIRTKADRNHIYLTLFVLFMALSHLLTSITPSLESHIAASYFGDIAVMSEFSSQAILVVGLLFGGWMLREWKTLTLWSFQSVNQSALQGGTKQRLFDLGTLLVTTMAIQNMGYLFTMGSLFIGTTFAANHSANLGSYTKKILLISTLGSLLGFTVSLASTVLPTVPCVLLGQLVVGVLSYAKK